MLWASACGGSWLFFRVLSNSYVLACDTGAESLKVAMGVACRNLVATDCVCARHLLQWNTKNARGAGWASALIAWQRRHALPHGLLLLTTTPPRPHVFKEDRKEEGGRLVERWHGMIHKIRASMKDAAQHKTSLMILSHTQTASQRVEKTQIKNWQWVPRKTSRKVIKQH